MSSSTAPSDEHIRAQYIKREETFQASCEKDKTEVQDGLERERSFMVQWNRLSRNLIWSKEQGPPVVLYQGTVDDYKAKGKEIWPWGHNVQDLTIYGQIWGYFCFMWNRTRPRLVAMLIVVMTLSSPIRIFLLGYITNEIVQDPSGVELWLYFTPFYLSVVKHILYWWYEMLVPLNSQRYQLRCVLLTRRVQLPDSHPLAQKWTPGRFGGLLKDVDELVNGVWKGCLQIIELTVTVVWTLGLCLSNLAIDFKNQGGSQETSGSGYGIYVGVFLGLGFLVLTLPFLWFHFFNTRLSECEIMVQEGQAMYLSSAGEAVMASETTSSTYVSSSLNQNGSIIESDKLRNDEKMTTVGREAFRVFAFTTFRSFFFRLAWTTNYDLLSQISVPLISYWLLTTREFGTHSVTSTIIILRSLTELVLISKRILALLTVMAKGCLVLVKVAELLNAGLESSDARGSDAKNNELHDDDLDQDEEMASKTENVDEAIHNEVETKPR
jgi:hypothetical protein